MFREVTVKGLTGSEQNVTGHFIEQMIVRDGDEEPIMISKDVMCAPGLHIITAGMLAFPMPKGMAVCEEHVSSIMTQQKYDSYLVSLSRQTDP